jgi:NAD(P)-dependent dehydrogenase (short-subunit alcohol dehydrogenase family)
VTIPNATDVDQSKFAHDWLGLTGRVCVVTGAAGGIGAEISRQLLVAGARVVMLDRDISQLNHAVQKLNASTTQVQGMACDVTQQSSVASVAERIQSSWGACELLVNNAAALHADAVMDIELAKWDQLLSVNLSGYLLCAQMFGRQMRANGRGAMVHVASISASIPQPYSGAYSVSKAGVKMLSQLLAVELGEHNIRSNVVSPAMIRTPMSEGIYLNPAVLHQREAIVPVGRISTPRDIAETVLFLACDRASYISGQEILVDGGLTQAWLGMIPRPGFEKQDADISA